MNVSEIYSIIILSNIVGFYFSKGFVILKKIIRLSIYFLLVLCVFFTSTPNVFGDEWLPAPIIKGLEMTKNETDPDQSNTFTKESYPFTISFTFDDATLSQFSYDTVALLESCSFYPLPGVGEYSAFFDYEKKTFTFYNMLYSGDGRDFVITIADKGYIQKISFNIGYVVPSTNITSSTNSEVISSKSNENSSSKSSSSKESSSKVSSAKAPSLPASITPKILVSSYSFSETLKSSTPFTVSIEIENSSTDIAAEGIIITFDQGKSNNEIKIINSTNIKYIPFLAPLGKETIEIECISENISEVIVQSLSASINFQYYDIEGENPIKANNDVILNFYTKENHTLRIERIQLPDEVYLNEIFNLNFRIVNLGLSKAKNVDISVINEDGAEISRTFIGAIEPSTATTEPSIPLKFNSLGDHNLIFKVYYTENNETKSISSPFKIIISERPLEEDESSENSSSEESSSKKPAIIIEKSKNSLNDSVILGIFVTIIIITVSYIIYLLFEHIVIAKKSKNKDNHAKSDNKLAKSILNDLKKQNANEK